MASPQPDVDMDEVPPLSEGQCKRKRSDDETDDDGELGQTLFIPDESSITLEAYGATIGAEHHSSEDGDLEPDGEDERDDDDGESDMDSDESLSGDDNSKLKVYGQNEEPFPPRAYYDNHTPGIVTALVSIPKKIEELLTPYDCDGKHVKPHLGAAKVPGNLPSKRSTFNGIVDIRDFAKSLGGGQSCTCVPTEYTNAMPGQRKQFAAVVRYFDYKNIRRILSDFVKDFNTWEFDEDPDWDEELRQQFHKRCFNAVENITVLFRDLDEFATPELTKAYLRKDYKDESSHALNIMLDACEVKLKDKIKDNGAYSEFRESEDLEAFRKAIDPLMNSSGAGTRPRLWPLVQNVRIGVRGSRALDKITIIDLPGITDISETRATLTKEYIKTCDHLWVVTPISRVIDDGLTFSVLHRYGRLFKGQISVVCTHADADIDSKLARELRAQGIDVHAYYLETEKLKSQKREVKKLSQKIKSQRRLTMKRQTKQKMFDTQTHQHELEQMKAELQATESRRFQCLVEARNTFVTQQLQFTISDHLPDGIRLAVFCVSNGHYAAIKKGRFPRGARLSPEATGIPALRAHAIALAASGLMRTLHEYANVSLTVFIKNAQLWVKTTHVEHRTELLDIVRAPQEKVAVRIAARSRQFNESVKKILTEGLHEQWLQSQETAIKVLKAKNKRHHSTIRAFIRKNGRHESKLFPKENWNEQFNKGVVDYINTRRGEFEHNEARITADLKEALIEDIRAILPNIAESQPLSVHVLPVTRLEELVEAQIGVISSALLHDGEQYRQTLRNVQMDATLDSDANYFTSTLIPVYDECNMDRGTGVTARCLAKVEAHLTKKQEDSPFTEVEKKLVKALRRSDDKQFSKTIEKKVQKVFESLYASFDRLIDKTVEHPTEKAAREALMNVLPRLQKDYEAVKARLVNVQAKYESSE